jgi:two-component system, cell cycle sensor histidine kinase and response regulator CckA
MRNRLRRWLRDLPIDDPIERQQALLVQIVLLGLSGVLLFSALLTLVAFPFTSGAIATANLRNSISNIQGTLLVLAPFVFLRRGYFRVAVAILMIELFVLAFTTFYTMGLEAGWIGPLEFALPISLAALALGRRWLLAMYAASTGAVTATAFAWYPLTGTPSNALSASIGFALIAGLLTLFLDRFGTTFRGSLTALRVSEERSRATVDAALDGIITIDATGRVVEFNPAAEQIFGYRRAEVLRRELAELIIPPSARDEHRLALAHSVATGNAPILGRRIELTAMRADGTTFPVELSVARIITAGQLQFTGFVRDLTDRKRLEAQFFQVQKVESIGRLAGGIAHDFNNLLTAISGYTDLARETLSANHPASGDLEEVQKAAQRATALTGQLLAFARKQPIEPHIVNLNELIRNMDRLLRRVIGEHIDLVTQPAADLGQVMADPGQIEQVIVNLAVNARDAMPAGGKLTIETRNVVLDEAYIQGHVGSTEGPYVLLAVSDTGVGMDETVQRQVFEPFFTTKAPGKGTGLGLATCYGIIKQHGGFIWVYSEVGHGTTMKIYLPRVYEAAETLPHLDEQHMPRGSETVLLVEDELAVRTFAVRVLETAGYTVVAASDGAEALRYMEGEPRAIQLLLTDVVLPHMNGKVLAEQLTADAPTLKVLYMSGYADDAIVHHGRIEVGLAFLHKPFSPGTLLRKVREVLDQDTL